jgi:bifunctional isochorismate lyase/aryl carrier protein
MTADTIRAQIAELLGEDAGQIADDDNLIDWGLDSIRLMTLVERWRAAGALVELSDLAERPTIAAWAELLVPAGR